MKIKRLYYVKTENNFNQILIFGAKKEAFNWLKKTTCWNDEKIENSVLVAEKGECNFFKFALAVKMG